MVVLEVLLVDDDDEEDEEDDEDDDLFCDDKVSEEALGLILLMVDLKLAPIVPMTDDSVTMVSCRTVITSEKRTERLSPDSRGERGVVMRFDFLGVVTDDDDVCLGDCLGVVAGELDNVVSCGC